MSISFEQARHNMVEQQIRPWEVLDPRVLEVLEKIHREDFVPARYRKFAMADLEIPLAENQSMLKPVIEARILQSLQIQSQDTILEIGTGSGFMTACLAKLGHSVSSLEVFSSLSEKAEKKLNHAGIDNVELISTDALKDYALDRKFDVIVFTGALSKVPDSFKLALKPGGRLFAITGQQPIMEAVLLTRVRDEEWSKQYLFETSAPWLVHGETPKVFQF